MPKIIEIGEGVIGTTAIGGWGTRQVIGRLAGKLDKPDIDGNKYIIQLPSSVFYYAQNNLIRVKNIRRCPLVDKSEVTK